jgi:hypothetical protein
VRERERESERDTKRKRVFVLTSAVDRYGYSSLIRIASHSVIALISQSEVGHEVYKEKMAASVDMILDRYDHAHRLIVVPLAPGIAS